MAILQCGLYSFVMNNENVVTQTETNVFNLYNSLIAFSKIIVKTLMGVIYPTNTPTPPVYTPL